jgi:hypothetical protein
VEINYSTFETASAEPEATSMIETFRAIGYSLETAVADIIDNSVSAGAKNIWFDYHWNGPKTTVSITDDGIGMDNEELIKAMRPGSRNPLEARDATDLGRFGLGLKTASFSQSRKFSVISKKTNNTEVYWSWDLDYVSHSNSWSLIKYHPGESFLDKVTSLPSGTCVVWWDLDRLTKDTSKDSEASKSKFFATMEKVKKHLSMVFHRFIEEGLIIYFRGRKLDAWDPFMIGHEGLQVRPETIFSGGKITIRGFILPHRSRLSPDQYNYGKGPQDSWTAQQGFYVYRNKRLLVAGDWLGLFKREAQYDLCRIKVDLTNDLDSEWQIDIKKSQAKPPQKYRDQIFSLTKDSRNQAVEVYRHRGKVLKRKLVRNEYHPFWEEKTRHGKRFYSINRNHPIIQNILGSNLDFKKDIEQALTFIEETVPVPLIMVQENEDEKPHGKPFEGTDSNPLVQVMKSMYNSLLQDGLSEEDAKARIANIDPFDYYLEHLENI